MGTKRIKLTNLQEDKKRTRRIRNSHSRSHSAVQTHFYWVHAPFSVCANIIVIVTSKWGTSSCIGDIRTPEKSSEMTAMWWQGHNSLRKTVVNATLSIHTFSSIGCYCCCCFCNYFFFVVVVVLLILVYCVCSESFNLSHSVLMIGLLFSLPQLVTWVAALCIATGASTKRNM